MGYKTQRDWGSVFATFIVVVLLMLVPVLIAPFVDASPPPSTMNFQGRLRDNSGNIMPDGLYNMQFRIFTASTGGTAVWTETRETTNRVQLTNGLFSVQLGEVTPLTSSVFNATNLYFEITMATPATSNCSTASCASWESPMTPRNKLATSAYAFNAASLNGYTEADFAAASGSVNYIQNTSNPQTANFNITGTGTVGTVHTANLDTATATALTIGASNATSVTVAKDLTVSAGKTISMVGGATSLRPASPSEGMMYFDTDNKQLMTYANGKWQGDRSTSTVIVGTSANGGASGAVASKSPDGADFVNASDTSAQTVINQAIASLPATGGSVYLMEGVYVIDAAIVVPSNVLISGAGIGTVIKLKNNAELGINAIENSDLVNGNEGITIRDFSIDGNKTANPVETFGQTGILFKRVGKPADSAPSLITRLYVKDFTGKGINVLGSSYEKGLSITDSVIYNNDKVGVDIDWLGEFVFSRNRVLSNGESGIFINDSEDGIVSDNVISANMAGINAVAVMRFNITNNTVSDTTCSHVTAAGIVLDMSDDNTVSGNTLSDNCGSTSISSLRVRSSSSNNTVSHNKITDTAGTGHAILIDSNATETHLTGNVYSGTGATTISDLSASTTYANQTDGSGKLITRSSGGFAVQNSAGTDVLNVDSSTSLLTIDGDVSLAAGQSITLTGGDTASRPVAPDEGTIYFDSETDELLVYANSSWQPLNGTSTSGGGSLTATKIVAANDSTQAIKDMADYVADGNADDVEINTALTAATGGSVYLAEGTYSITDVILVPNDTTLQGSGDATEILYDVSSSSGHMIEASGVDKTGQIIRDLKLDGIGSAYSGIYLFGVGETSTFTSTVVTRPGGEVSNVTMTGFTSSGIYLETSSDVTIRGSTIQDTYEGIALISNSNSNHLLDNYIEGNAGSGFRGVNAVYPGYGNEFSRNTISNFTYGITLVDQYDFQIMGNRISDMIIYGIDVQTDSSGGLIKDNYVYESGSMSDNNSIYIGTIDSVSIIDNHIVDTYHSVSNDALVVDATSAYVSGNILNGGGISDAGGDIEYINQIDSSGRLTVRSSGGFAVQNSAGTDVLNVDSSTSLLTIDGDVSLAAGQSITLTGGDTASRPVAPDEGTIYFDSETSELLVYANSSWQPLNGSSGGSADGKTATKIVAASNSPQAVKDSADYVADGTADEVEINDALTAAAGGVVYLAGGAYSVSDSITVPSDTRLTGAGSSTQITLNSAVSNVAVIKNRDTGVGSNDKNIVIERLKIDGNDNGASSRTGVAIYSDTWYSPLLTNNTVSEVEIEDVRTGIFSISYYSVIKNNIVNARGGAIDLEASKYSEISGNRISGADIFTLETENLIISNNRISDSGGSDHNLAIVIDDGINAHVTDNYITDSSALISNIAIDINAPSSAVYLSGNVVNGGGVSDGGEGTIYDGQIDDTGKLIMRSSGGFGVQNALGTDLLNVNSTTGLLTVSDDALFKTTSTAAFVVQNSAGVDLLTADTQNNKVVIGSATNGVEFSANGIVLKGTARGTEQLVFSPEYNGLTFRGDGSNNVGTLITDFCSTGLSVNATACGTSFETNYYEWTTAEATAQDYDLYMTFNYPQDAAAASAGGITSMTMSGFATSTSTDSVVVNLYRAGTNCGSTTVSTTSGQWTTTSLASALTGCTASIVPGDKLTLRIRLTAAQNNFARAGDIVLNYKTTQ